MSNCCAATIFPQGISNIEDTCNYLAAYEDEVNITIISVEEKKEERLPKTEEALYSHQNHFFSQKITECDVSNNYLLRAPPYTLS